MLTCKLTSCIKVLGQHYFPHLVFRLKYQAQVNSTSEA